MNRQTTAFLLFSACLIAQGPNRCASANSTGNPGDGSSFHPSLSADGRYCAFQSAATDLVPNDTNGEVDVFVKDLTTGAVALVSVASNGALGNGPSSEPKLSADGRYVVFVTRASNFSTFDTNGRTDVYRHDRLTGQTVLVSCSALGIVGNDGSGRPTVSGDGRCVAFHSLAANLAPADGNGVADILVKDLQTSACEIVSNASPTVGGDFSAVDAAISRDGRFVAFGSYATNLVPGDGNGTADVFVRDRQTGTTHRTSARPGGLDANGPSDVLAITADGSSVLFRSWASNLVAGDGNGCADLFVAPAVGGAAECVSVGSGGVTANGNSLDGAITADGRCVAFSTYASNLVAGDTNQALDVLQHDRVTGLTVRVSLDLGGASPNGPCQMPAIDDAGALVVFSTYAHDVLAAPTGGHDQIVAASLQMAQNATFSTLGQGCPGAYGVPSLMRDPETLPWTGTTVRLTGDRARSSTLGLLALGFSTTQWNGVPLPAPLAAYGMGACTLFTSVDLTVPFFTTGQGTWTVGLDIPAGAGWLGVALHTQAWLVDGWANALGAVVTNAATLGIGG